MAENGRDTYFQDFAKPLWEELQRVIVVDCGDAERHPYPSPPETSKEVELLIAQHVYDLVVKSDARIADFAKSLWEEMMALHNGIDVGPDGLDEAFAGMETEYKTLIARRVSDFLSTLQ